MPLIVTVPPPESFPLVGLTPVIVGVSKYVYPPVEVSVPASVVSTTLYAVPPELAVFAGVAQVICVSEITFGELQVDPPTVTVAFEAPLKIFVPVTSMVVLPATVPFVGTIEVIVGAEI